MEILDANPQECAVLLPPFIQLFFRPQTIRAHHNQ